MKALPFFSSAKTDEDFAVRLGAVSFVIQCLLLLLVCSSAKSQSFSEVAMLPAELKQGGSARILGIGSAGVALGGELSLSSINPASLGMIRKSQASLTLTGASTSISALYQNDPASTDYTDSKLSVGNLGVAIHLPDFDGSGFFKSGAFSINFTQNSNFNQELRYSGDNEDNSIVDSYLERANGNVDYQSFDEDVQLGYFDDLGLAYGTNLLRPIRVFRGVGDDSYVVIDDFSYGAVGGSDDFGFRALFDPVRQTETIRRKGAVGEWDFAFGVNRKDKLYLGASIGVQTFRFEQEREFEENAIESNFELEGLTFTESLDVRGTGINLELGGNYRISNLLRVGLSVTTPTWYEVDELYESTMETRFRADTLAVFSGFEDVNGISVVADTVYQLGTGSQNPRFFAGTGVLENKYSIRTPFRMEAGLATFLGKHGFLSADVEYVGYRATKLSVVEEEGFLNNDFTDSNAEIKEFYKNRFNFRVGGEGRVGKFRLRGGFAYYANALKEATSENARKFVSAGLGYKSTKWFADIAWVHQLQNEFFYSPYTTFDERLGNSPQVQATQTATNITVTCGVSF